MRSKSDTYQLGEKPTYSQIHETLESAVFSHLPTMRIVVLRNIMVDGVVPYLRYFAYRMGFAAEVILGGFDNVVQESLGSDPTLFGPGTNCILIFAYLETLAPRIARSYAALSREEAMDEMRAVHEYISTSLEGIRRQSNAMVLWHAFESPAYPSLGILDGQSSDGQLAAIAGLNAYLLDRLKQAGNAYLVDTNLCVNRVGAKTFYDSRYWHIGKAPYSREALAEIGKEDFKFIRSRMGKGKKCLVLDCDNTLWGGILGEEGINGIQLGRTHPGSSYREFQQEILNLYNRGILIALCSKNNEQDVWDVFDGHAEMLLKREHIASAQINWLDKATNLTQTAKDLNIGLDSMVFVDDSEFEANLVRSMLPEVEVILLPAGKSVGFREILASSGLFDSLTLSDEDKTRGAMYVADKKRQILGTKISNLEDYYRSLEMVAELQFADKFAAPRVAQQTQKTNQFNLTTRRYSDTDIEKLSVDDNSDVIYLKLSDTFGEVGLIGTCILRYEGTDAFIDTFLLSCRALGRTVEDVFLKEVLAFLKRKGVKAALGEYIATTKNQQVETFYPRHGFHLLDSGAHGVSAKFVFNLDDLTWNRPEYFREINSHLN